MLVNVVLMLLVKTYGRWVLVLELCHVAKHILLCDDAQQTTACKREREQRSCIHCAVPTFTCTWLASFPGPAQLSVACSTKNQEEPGIFSHVSMEEQN